MTLNFEDFFSGLLIKKFSIREKTQFPPKIAEEQYMWTDQSLVKVLRNYSNSLKRNTYLLKYDELFLELLYLLNEGYITYQVEEYDYLMVDFSEDRENAVHKMNQIPQELHEELATLFRYSNEITMNFSIWEKLCAAGARDFKFSNRNYSIHAKDIDVMVKTGDVSIKHLLSSFEKGIKQFIVAPYSTTDKGIVYIFSTTAKYMNLVKNKAQQKKELKKTFSKIKGDYTLDFPGYNNENLDSLDMVECIYKGKKIRGYIYEILNTTSDFDQFVGDVLKEKRKQESVNELDRFFNFKQKANVNIYFTSDEFYAADYIIKALRKTKTSESHNYYAVNKKDILSYWSMNNRPTIGETLRQMLILGKNINPTITYNVDNGINPALNSNAYYTPIEHSITINIDTIYNSAYENYTLHGYHPNDFAMCVIAHELGHADARGIEVFDNQYIPRVERINKLNKIIEQEIEQIELSVEPNITMIQETVKKCTERVELLQQHYKIVLQSEMNAYLYGIDYIPYENVKRVFQKNNYDSYTNYLEQELIPIRNAQRQLYELQRLIQLLE